MATTARIAVLGGSGYTGAETMRLALAHPRLEIRHVTADRQAGKAVAEVFPHLAGRALPDLVKIGDVPFDEVDAVICCLPHATTQEVVSALPRHLKVVDLSADFRLADPAVYERAYGRPHGALDLQTEAVYGLTEHARPALERTRLVAVPGCYPTGPQLALKPLLAAQAIDVDSIVIDAKSGITGAGRSLKENLLFAEADGGFSAYAIGTHRHIPEIEQGLSEAAGEAVRVSFTPHLVPMNRGILATSYVRLMDGCDRATLEQILTETYAGEPFVRVVTGGRAPSTQEVRGTNDCLVSVHDDRRHGHAIVFTVIDNLLKGAAGQAIQDLNVVMGFEETLGLGATALFP